MSADKRSPLTDALATLGTIITPEEKRDAIHLAVIPVQATEQFFPGDHVTTEGDQAYACSSNESVGIVDPFLTERVAKGQWFWLIIKPREITSLRHVWAHPHFPDEKE